MSLDLLAESDLATLVGGATRLLYRSCICALLCLDYVMLCRHTINKVLVLLMNSLGCTMKYTVAYPYCPLPQVKCNPLLMICAWLSHCSWSHASPTPTKKKTRRRLDPLPHGLLYRPVWTDTGAIYQRWRQCVPQVLQRRESPNQWYEVL